MAAWQITPPTSVTIPADARIATTMSGLVIGVTSTDPFSSRNAWSMLNTRCVGPEPIPPLAAVPVSRASPIGEDSVVRKVVIGRVWTTWMRSPPHDPLHILWPAELVFEPGGECRQAEDLPGVEP